MKTSSTSLYSKKCRKNSHKIVSFDQLCKTLCESGVHVCTDVCACTGVYVSVCDRERTVCGNEDMEKYSLLVCWWN